MQMMLDDPTELQSKIYRLTPSCTTTTNVKLKRKLEDPMETQKKFYKLTPSCANAAMTGDLQLLIELRNKGAEWDENTCINAINNKYYGIFKWAHSAGCPVTVESLKALIRTVDEENMNILTWMCFNLRIKPDADVFYIATERKSNFLTEWLHTYQTKKGHDCVQ
jgi:hypothetical protein